AAVRDTDDRDACAQGEVHHLGDLLPVHFSEGPAEHGEVLGVDTHLTAVDRAVPGDDAVAGDLSFIEPEIRGTVHRERVDLHDTAVVAQRFEPVPCGFLAPRALLFSGDLRVRLGSLHGSTA